MQWNRCEQSNGDVLCEPLERCTTIYQIQMNAMQCNGMECIIHLNEMILTLKLFKSFKFNVDCKCHSCAMCKCIR